MQTVLLGFKNISEDTFQSASDAILDMAEVMGADLIICLKNRKMRKEKHAAKSLHSCPTLCEPIDGSPPGSPVPGILQARTLEWVAISFSNA